MSTDTDISGIVNFLLLDESEAESIESINAANIMTQLLPIPQSVGNDYFPEQNDFDDSAEQNSDFETGTDSYVKSQLLNDIDSVSHFIKNCQQEEACDSISRIYSFLKNCDAVEVDFYCSLIHESTLVDSLLSFANLIPSPPREILHLIGAIVECGGHEHLLRFTVPRCVSWLGSSLTLRHSDNLNCQMSLDILTRLCRYAPCLEAIKKYKILLTASKIPKENLDDVVVLKLSELTAAVATAASFGPYSGTAIVTGGFTSLLMIVFNHKFDDDCTRVSSLEIAFNTLVVLLNVTTHPSPLLDCHDDMLFSVLGLFVDSEASILSRLEMIKYWPEFGGSNVQQVLSYLLRCVHHKLVCVYLGASSTLRYILDKKDILHIVSKAVAEHDIFMTLMGYYLVSQNSDFVNHSYNILLSAFPLLSDERLDGIMSIGFMGAMCRFLEQNSKHDSWNCMNTLLCISHALRTTTTYVRLVTSEARHSIQLMAENEIDEAKYLVTFWEVV